MIGGLQGEEWKFIQKYLKKNIQKCRSQISGSTRENFRCTVQNGREIISQQKGDFTAMQNSSFILE